MPDALTRRAARWAAVTILILMAYAVMWGGMGWESYSQEWLAKMFKAASGGVLGWAISHYVTGLDLSDFRDQSIRVEAAKSKCMYIIGFALALCV
jgi:zinc transporter ZupT